MIAVARSSWLYRNHGWRTVRLHVSFYGQTMQAWLSAKQNRRPCALVQKWPIPHAHNSPLHEHIPRNDTASREFRLFSSWPHENRSMYACDDHHFFYACDYESVCAGVNVLLGHLNLLSRAFRMLSCAWAGLRLLRRWILSDGPVVTKVVCGVEAQTISLATKFPSRNLFCSRLSKMFDKTRALQV